MKKFLVYLLAVVLVAAMGFSVFYLVRDNETLSITNTSLYKEVGDQFSVGLNTKKLKSYTTIKLNEVGDLDSIEKLSENLNPSNGKVEASFKATQGGTVRVNFQTNNSKFRNLYCDIIIGDGSSAHPYQISTAEQLYSIGREGSKYDLGSYYEIVTDLDCSTVNGGSGLWVPVEDAFTGKINGNGFAIKNLTFSAEAADSATALGLFTTVTGTIDNVVLDSVDIDITGTTGEYYVGSIAAFNKGTISRVNVQSVTVNSDNAAAVIGGVVAVNEKDVTLNKQDSGRIDRVSANVKFAYTDLSGSEPVVYGIKGALVAGVVAKNIGGTVVNAYSVGEVTLEGDVPTTFAGIVNYNISLGIDSVEGYDYNDLSTMTEVKLSDGANIKNCYSAINIDMKGTGTLYIAGIVHTNYTGKFTSEITEGAVRVNTIAGNYYLNTMKEETDTIEITNNFEKYLPVDDVYTAVSKSAEELKTQTTYKSYNYEWKYQDGAYKRVYDEDVTWDFDNVWGMLSTVNNGYPYLTYSDSTSSDGINNVDKIIEITNADQLLAMHDDVDNAAAGEVILFVIKSDIDMEGRVWTPLGSPEKPFIHQVKGELGAGTSPTISNLTVVATAKNAGFIDTLGSNAKVSDLKFVNFTATLDNVSVASEDDHNIVGVVAAYNGTSQIKTSIIENIEVVDANLQGRIAVAGIAGYNYGLIKDCTVNGAEGSTIEACSSIKNVYVAGVAAYNAGSIVTTNVTGKVSVIIGEVLGNTKRTVYAGGVAGVNTGLITSSVVDTEAGYGIDVTNHDSNIDSVNYMVAGGVVGSNESGKIHKCYVSMDITIPGLSISDSNGTYAGGIAGVLRESYSSIKPSTTVDEYEAQYSIYGCVVKDCSISIKGNMVRTFVTGGLVGYMNIDGIAVKVNNKAEFEANQQLHASVVASYVENVTLGGTDNGGFAGEIIAGVISDCGANVKFIGSRNFGFAVTLMRNPSASSSSQQVAGVVARSYVTIAFKSGKLCYSISETHLKPSDKPEATGAGYVQGCMYSVVEGDVKDQKGIATFNSTGSTQSDLEARAKAFTDNGFASSSWLLPSGITKTYWKLNGSLVELVRNGLPVPEVVLSLISE